MSDEIMQAILNGDADIYKYYAALPPDIQAHAERVAAGTMQLLQLAQEAGLCEEELPEKWQVYQAIRYHDVGMVAIPERLLCKRDDLTAAERRVIQRHAGYGAKLLEQYRSGKACSESENTMWRLATEIAVGHHERWDGKGYPFGVLATAVPLLARATAIIDAYDAITRGSYYCMPLPHDYALVEILDNTGTQFDPELANLFLTHARQAGVMADWPLNEQYNRREDATG